MNHDTLARQFDDAAGALTAAGHSIIVRKARELLSAGDVDGAMAFVQEASERTPLMAINTLNSALVAWKSAGNKARDLQRNPAWKAGSVRDDRAADSLAQLPTDDVQGLMGALIAETQQAGALTGDGPGTLTGPQAIGSIFGQRDTGSQPVEEASNLVAKPLALDDAPPAPEPPPQQTAKAPKTPKAPPPVESAPPPAIEPKAATPPPAEVDAVAAPVEAPSKPAPPPPPAEVEAPKGTDVKQADDGNSSLWLGLAIAVAVIVLVIWYMNRPGS